MRGEIDPEDSHGQWLIHAMFYNSSDTYLGYEDAEGGQAGTLSTTWQQRGGTISTPSNAATMRIYLHNYMNSGWVAYGDVSLSWRRPTSYCYGQRARPEQGRRIAMRRDGVVYYLVGDHLGTTSLVLDGNGDLVAETRHFPYGEERWPVDGTVPTDYRFTGQRIHSYIKLYLMGARWLIPAMLDSECFTKTPLSGIIGMSSTGAVCWAQSLIPGEWRCLR